MSSLDIIHFEFQKMFYIDQEDMIGATPSTSLSSFDFKHLPVVSGFENTSFLHLQEDLYFA